MSFGDTYINFEVVPSSSCKTLIIVDSSYYNPSQTITGNTLLVKVPGYKNPVELSYTQTGVTVLNSNSLGITNVGYLTDLTNLPDGNYIIKMTVCPYETYWFEMDYYRTCQIECKYDNALLKLDYGNCSHCFDNGLSEKLNTAWRFIQGIKANSKNGNIVEATNCWNTANKILDGILQGKDCKNCK